jgi:hypothetical protein
MARPKLAPGKRKVSKSTTLFSKDIELFLRLGDGDLSKGIAQAANIVRQSAKEVGIDLEKGPVPDETPAPTLSSLKAEPSIFD